MRNKIKKTFLGLFGIVFFLSCTNIMLAQTRVIKKTATKSNDYGVNYFLPKSVLNISVRISKIETKAGPYFKYAEKYLGMPHVISENSSYYELDEVCVTSDGIPDKDKSYLVELKSGTFAPFVYLTEDGLICSINAEYTPDEQIAKSGESVNPENKDSKMSPYSLFTEEYLQAGSTGKMAEVAAKQIYKIRESRMDILTGNSENAPRDGAAMKLVLQQLEDQEKALVELFSGSTSKHTQTFHFDIEPKSEMEKEIIFRFSKHLGIVRNDDLSGVPVYINLKKLDIVGEVSAEPDKKKSSKGEKSGIVYNIPGKAEVEVYYGTSEIFKGNVDITQFGITQVLANSLFEDKKAPVKIYFYPQTGGIKKINQ